MAKALELPRELLPTIPDFINLAYQFCRPAVFLAVYRSCVKEMLKPGIIIPNGYIELT
jgi:hypothetical protein